MNFTNDTEQKLLTNLLASVDEMQRNNLSCIDAISKAISYTGTGEKVNFSSSADIADITDKEKTRAAYALNIITVSVSQIIKYNDLNFMELEYETILNNLNLENFPKDEPLLNIIKQILNVICFFKIQDKEKAMLEKNYNQKVKNAIWSAVPNFGLVLGAIFGKNPTRQAVSFAASVGTSYMNYRREKTQIMLDKESEELKLQMSAAEQLYGLQRELFDTAWRLSEKYGYEDNLRLSQRQIERYNTVLMDEDPIRRYERLEIMKDEFEAYPPFWYYFGNAANLSYYRTNDNYYKNHAFEYYDKYLNFIKENELFREDHIAASCALEYFDLLPDDEKRKRKDLLLFAEKKSGRSYDTLQLCAFEYINADEKTKACQLLKELVNEGYNIDVNVRLLGSLYCIMQLENDKISLSYQNEYYKLENNNPEIELLPLPNNKCDEATFKKLCDERIRSLQYTLENSYLNTIRRIYCRFETRWNYTAKLKTGAYNEISNLLSELITLIGELFEFGNTSLFEDKIRAGIKNNESSFKLIQTTDKNNSNLSFYTITESAFSSLGQKMIERIHDLDAITKIESERTRLMLFCAKHELYKIEESENIVQPDIADKILGYGYEKKEKHRQLCEDLLSTIKNHSEKIFKRTNDDYNFIYMNSAEFDDIICNTKTIDKNDTFAIMLNNKEKYFFTLEGIFARGIMASYSNISRTNIPTQLYFENYRISFSSNFVDTNELCDLLHTIGTKIGNKTAVKYSNECKKIISRLKSILEQGNKIQK